MTGTELTAMTIMASTSLVSSTLEAGFHTILAFSGCPFPSWL
jgi:hypothetical protein